MTLEEFKIKVRTAPLEIDFSDTIAVIEANWSFIPTAFVNGDLQNKAGQNSGSCKVFAFAIKEELSKEETLACFGDYYFKEVLNDPNGDGHQNIRNFIKTGFKGLSFEGEPLK